MTDPLVPKVAIIVRPIDDGRNRIGILECPHCGQDHFTTVLSSGERNVFCGRTPDGKLVIRRVNVTKVL